MDFITGGDGDPGSVRDKLRELEQRKSEISAELATRRGNMKIEVHPNLHELYRRKVSNLRQLLENETTRPQAVETVRSLIDRIEISPGLRRGRCEVLITGALANILDFVQARTSAETQAGTFLMVAGVGFEPTTRNNMF